MTIITHAIAFVLGGVAVYLFFRNNPKWKAKADAAADAAEQKLKER